MMSDIRKSHGGNSLSVRAGFLNVTCWCENHFVQVPSAVVRDGRTRSCGSPRCHGPIEHTETR